MPKQINQQQLYYSAIGFYRAGLDYALKIKDTINNDNFIVSPVCTVNLSFSAELFVKLLYFITTNETELYEHKLQIIYPKLSEDVRQRIEDVYATMKIENDDSLNIIKMSLNTEYGNPSDQKSKYDIDSLSITELLDIHNESFVKWRYIFESPTHYVAYDYNIKLMNKFILSLKVVCDEIVEENNKLKLLK